VRTITMTFLSAALLVGPFEAFGQTGGTERDSTPTSVPHKKSKNKKKKRAPSNAKKLEATTQSNTPLAPAQSDTPIAPAQVALPAAPPPAVDPAPASANPAPQRPTMGNAVPPITVHVEPQREHRGLLLVAPKVGVFKSTTALQAAFYSGAELGVATPLLDQHLAVVFELDWVRPHYSSSIADPRLPSGGGAFALGQSEFGFLLSAVYRFEDAVPGLTPYGGLGPGLYYQRAALTAFGNVNVESESKLGFQLLGGADYRLGPGALFGEVRYHYSKVDFIGTGNVNVGGFLALGVGYRLRFF
jgi:hypothetical protein